MHGGGTAAAGNGRVQPRGLPNAPRGTAVPEMAPRGTALANGTAMARRRHGDGTATARRWHGDGTATARSAIRRLGSFH